MEEVLSLTTVNSDGQVKTWKGRGQGNVVHTKTPISGEPVGKWPDVTYVYVYLLTEED